MDSPDPEGMSLLAKVIGAAAAIIVPSWAGWNWLDKRFARKHEVTTQLQAVHSELGTLRTTQGKIFDQMRDMEKVSEERHREVLMHLLGRQ